VWSIISGLVCLTAIQSRIFGEETNSFTLTSKEGNFSIKFPSKPKEFSFDRQTIKGLIPYHMWLLERPDKAYNITYIDIPDVTPDQGETLVDSTLASMIAERIGGKLLGEKDASIGHHPGKEFTIEAPDSTGLYLGRAYMIGVRQFTLLVFGETKRDQKEDLIFLDSFRLLTNRPPEQAAAPNRKTPQAPSVDRR
jgi:hypothetical protein